MVETTYDATDGNVVDAGDVLNELKIILTTITELIDTVKGGGTLTQADIDKLTESIDKTKDKDTTTENPSTEDQALADTIDKVKEHCTEKEKNEGGKQSFEHSFLINDKEKCLESLEELKKDLEGKKKETEKTKEVEDFFAKNTEYFEESTNKNDSSPLVILVNGYWSKGLIQKDLLGFSDGKYQEEYWGNSLLGKIYSYFNSAKNYYVNGASTMFSNGKNRFENGYEFAKARFANKESKFYKEVFAKNRKILIVSHSMGSAFSEGVIKFLTKKKIPVEKVVHLSPADNSDFEVSLPNKSYQIDIDFDPVLAYKNFDDKNTINKIKNWGVVDNPDNDLQGHGATKISSYTWDWFEDLEALQFDFKGVIDKVASNIGIYGVKLIGYEKYETKNLKHNTVFDRIIKNGVKYSYFPSFKQYLKER